MIDNQCIPKVCLPNKNTTNVNLDVYDYFKEGNEGFEEPGRQGRRRSEDPLTQSTLQRESLRDVKKSQRH